MEYLLLTGHGQLADQKSTSVTAAATNRPYLRIITPSDPEQRGNQLSIWFSIHVGLVFQELAYRGVVVIYVQYNNNNNNNNKNTLIVTIMRKLLPERTNLQITLAVNIKTDLHKFPHTLN